ncbi:hypothetical protein MT418_000977 [Batrachochytrium dendrobatidis]
MASSTTTLSTEEYEQQYYDTQAAKQQLIDALATAGAAHNAASMFEYAVDKHQDLLCVCSVDHPRQYTFNQLEQEANRIAHWGQSIGLEQLQTIALMMENRPEFLAFTMGLAKIGVTVALINTNLTSSLLRHAINVSKAHVLIISPSKLGSWKELFTPLKSQDRLPTLVDSANPLEHLNRVYCYTTEHDHNVPDVESWSTSHIMHSLLSHQHLSGFSNIRPDASKTRNTVTDRTPLYYIYTSGTTGNSKAAKFSHKRFVGAAVTWASASKLERGEKYYIALPLYHGNAGVVAVAPCYLVGNPMVLREKFSVRNFFVDIRQHNCFATIYIGELWRYLLTLAVTPDEQVPTTFSPLKVAIGNGLSADIWTKIQARFGIQYIVEHYGSTEMPGDAILNYMGKKGSCGFVPRSESLAKSHTGTGGVIVSYDVEADCIVRCEQDGDRCIMCKPGQIGEMIMRLVDGVYDGYAGDGETSKKLYRSVFEKDDTWWRSGDLLKMDEQGFFYFVDRTGDSFRWKGENVSTLDVQKVVGAFCGIDEANVYGIKIPYADGRAGMASIVLSPDLKPTDFPFAAFTEHLEQHLPVYARPLFIRLTSNAHTVTSTLKFVKFVYVQEGYRCNSNDTVYMYRAAKKSWQHVDKSVADEIDAHGI